MIWMRRWICPEAGGGVCSAGVEQSAGSWGMQVHGVLIRCDAVPRALLVLVRLAGPVAAAVFVDRDGTVQEDHAVGTAWHDPSCRLLSCCAQQDDNRHGFFQVIVLLD